MKATRIDHVQLTTFSKTDKTTAEIRRNEVVAGNLTLHSSRPLDNNSWSNVVRHILSSRYRASREKISES